MDHFWHFVHSKCKRSSLRSQCWMRLFLWFSNTVRQHLLCMHKKQALLQVFDEYFVRNAFSEGYSLYPILLRPKSRGQISLRSSDPQDYPKIQPNYLTHPDDVKVLVEGLFLGNNECILMHLWSGLLASSRFPFHSKLTVKFFSAKNAAQQHTLLLLESRKLWPKFNFQKKWRKLWIWIFVPKISDLLWYFLFDLKYFFLDKITTFCAKIQIIQVIFALKDSQKSWLLP